MERSIIVIQQLYHNLSLLVRVVKWYSVWVILGLTKFSHPCTHSSAELCLDSAPRCPDSPRTWYKYWGCGPDLVPLALYRWASRPILLDPGISLDCRLDSCQASLWACLVLQSGLAEYFAGGQSIELYAIAGSETFYRLWYIYEFLV